MQKLELYKVLFSLIEENKQLNFQIQEATKYVDKIHVTADGEKELTSEVEKIYLYQNFFLPKISECKNEDYLNILKPKSRFRNVDFEKINTLTDEHLKLLGYEVDKKMFSEKTKKIATNEYFKFLHQNNTFVNKCIIKESIDVGQNKGLHIENYSDITFGKIGERNCIEQILTLLSMNEDILYLGNVKQFKNYETFLKYLISTENLPTFWQERIKENKNLKLDFDFNPIIDPNVKQLMVDTTSKNKILIKLKK